MARKKTEQGIQVGNWAKKFRVTERTIHRWIDEEAPFDDDDAMSRWVAARHRSHPTQNEENAEVLYELSNLPEPSDTLGAPAALERLQYLEKLYYDKLKREPVGSNEEKQVGNLYAKISANLLRYDAQITQARRGAGELLSREEIEVALRAATYYLRIAWQQAIEALADQLAAIEDPAELCKELKETLWNSALTAFSALAVKSGDLFPATKGANPKPSAAVPEWAKSAIITDLDNMLEGVPEEVRRRGAAIEKASREDGNV